MKFDYGPLRTFEVVWKSGHVETVQGHRVYFSGGAHELLGREVQAPARFNIYGDFPGGWRLVLSGLEDDVITIRDVTVPELADGAS
jgi:hypothetical protein